MAWTTPKTDFAITNLVTAAQLNNIGNNLIVLKEGVNDDGRLIMGELSALTLASGAVTATENSHVIQAETGTVDDLDTITAGGNLVAGSLLLIRADSGDTIVVRHNQGNIHLFNGSNVVLNDVNKFLALVYDGSADWSQLTPGESASLQHNDTLAGTTLVTTEEVLRTWTIPASTLSGDGNQILLDAYGAFEADANGKTVRLRWGGIAGTIIATGYNQDAAAITAWHLSARIVRLASNSQRWVGKTTLFGSTDGNAVSDYLGHTIHGLATETDTASIDLVVTGQNKVANVDNITYEASDLEIRSGALS